VPPKTYNYFSKIVPKEGKINLFWRRVPVGVSTAQGKDE
jgi:hypothetical protein